MNDILVKKEQLINQISELRREFLEVDIKYRELKCKLLLETDFNDVLNKSRPTVDDKKAYVDLKSLNIRKNKELLKDKIKYLECKMDLINNKIDFLLKE